MVSEAIEQPGGQLLVAEDLGPLENVRMVVRARSATRSVRRETTPATQRKVRLAPVTSRLRSNDDLARSHHPLLTKRDSS